ncbi:uncharacterized protein At2g34160-like [Zingiber officinale]|uniref:DNA/RNA-binding protein Alba-like domain-containing protein n=1 Tax=Zingiber officinale TaxID=94328 RepID=A0A8J5GX72_ZINOF|nr:uncharacterized protein At2g34160-like [Zingiber officinale]KAG6513403.1 hypothetical protein ZIOFF_023727 [Zingiber officinale]
METTTAAAGDGAVVAVGRGKKNRIQVSTNKKPLFFYVNLAKRYMQQHNEIELSALGMAIGTVVTVAEILKNNGLATAKKIQTSTVGTKDEAKGRLIRKAKIEILLGKTDNFNDIVAADNRTKDCSKDINNSAGKVSHGAAGNEKPDNSNGIAFADKVAQDAVEDVIVSADQAAREAAEDEKKK